MASVVPTTRPRPGRRFEPIQELALRDAALEACRCLPDAQAGLLVISEMTGPIGVPDFVAVVGDPGALNKRCCSSIPPLLNEVDAGVVAVSSDRVGRSERALAERLGWPESTVARRLPSLLRVGAMIEVKPGRYVRAPELRPLGKLFAVEAKVRDANRALRQARCYNVWADGYVLIMGPLSPGVRTRLCSEVRTDRAGLVVGGRWYARPRPRVGGAARQLWAAEHVVAALRGGRYQPSSVA